MEVIRCDWAGRALAIGAPGSEVTAKRRRRARPGALWTLAIRSSTDCKTSYLNLQRKHHFWLPDGNPRVKHLEKISTIF